MERANRGNHLLGLSALLSFGGTISAAYPVTAVIVTAVMMAPRALADVECSLFARKCTGRCRCGGGFPHAGL